VENNILGGGSHIRVRLIASINPAKITANVVAKQIHVGSMVIVRLHDGREVVIRLLSAKPAVFNIESASQELA
jgi:hypothetical protein